MKHAVPLPENERMVLCFDYDDTLSPEKFFPNAGDAYKGVKECIDELHSLGHILILSTCREGEYLERAVEALKDQGIIFDYVNRNADILLQHWKDTRKIGADMYIDDKGIGSWEWYEIMWIARRGKSEWKRVKDARTYTRSTYLPSSAE